MSSDLIITTKPSPMKFVLESCGVKAEHGLPEGADLYLDCRLVYDPSGKMTGTGVDPSVQTTIANHSPDTLKTFQSLVYTLIDSLGHRRKGQDPFSRPITIMCFCAWGIHRSVATKHLLAKWLRSLNSIYGVPIASVEVK